MGTRPHGEHLLKNAAGFLADARHLASGDRHSHEILLHHISCAIELSLKSFLQSCGWSDERCRDEIRHDLTKALEAARWLGFHPSHPDLPSLVAILSPYYCRHRLRDLAVHESALLSPQQALKATEELLSDVRAASPKGSRLGEPSSPSP
ncbi:MAG: hypothetical protein KIT76_00120 [Pseudolabrys sp.]|nr:hypothetical protein [Pseudolabrys sp.]MCW5697851.1 hypothetical protein [Bauldia sp.]